jgi:excisionase family DNA binding protein
VVGSQGESPQRVLLTVREVAFMLGCGRTLVYDLIGSRQLPIVKVGRLTRVPAAAVDNFVSRHLTTLSASAMRTPALSPRRRRVRSATAVSARGDQTVLFDDART